VSGNVTVGGKVCVLTGIGWRHTQIQCWLPEGYDINQPVVVYAGTLERACVFVELVLIRVRENQELCYSCLFLCV
jgi:hypothetical protein